MVESVATQRDGLVGGAFADESSLHVDACPVVEEERSARRYGERSTLLYGHRSVDYERLAGSYSVVGRDGLVACEVGVPRPRVEHHLLLHSTLKREHETIVKLLRSVAVVHGCSYFHEHAYAVLVAHLYAVCLIALFRTKIYSIYIHTKSVLVATFEAHGCAAQPLTRAVAHPEVARRRRHGREYGVNAHRVGREREQVVRRCCEIVDIVACA